MPETKQYEYQVMGNGYLSKEPEWVDIFSNPKEQAVKTMDAIIPVDLLDPDYPKTKDLYRLKQNFHDIHQEVWDELWEHRETILGFRKTYYQKTDRFIIVYPSGDNHRVKNVAPPRYVSIMNYDNDMFGNHGLTTMLHPATGTWMYLHKEKEIGPAISELIDRIKFEVIPVEDKDIVDEKYKVECALSFKGPGCLLNRHCDHDDNNNYYRYHAVLQSNPRNYIVTGNTPEDDYIVAPNVGEIWGFNVGAPHWAGNDSENPDDHSWHLIIDVIEKKNYQQGDRTIK